MLIQQAGRLEGAGIARQGVAEDYLEKHPGHMGATVDAVVAKQRAERANLMGQRLLALLLRAMMTMAGLTPLAAGQA